MNLLIDDTALRTLLQAEVNGGSPVLVAWLSANEPGVPVVALAMLPPSALAFVREALEARQATEEALTDNPFLAEHARAQHKQNAEHCATMLKSLEPPPPPPPSRLLRPRGGIIRPQ